MRRSVAILAPHAVLLVAAWLLVVRDATFPFGGAGLGASIVPLLAVMVAGAVRAARGIAGAKPLLLASDLGVAAVAGVTWAFSAPDRIDDPDLLYASTIVAVAVSPSRWPCCRPAGGRPSNEPAGPGRSRPRSSSWIWLPSATSPSD